MGCSRPVLQKNGRYGIKGCSSLFLAADQPMNSNRLDRLRLRMRKLVNNSNNATMDHPGNIRKLPIRKLPNRTSPKTARLERYSSRRRTRRRVEDGLAQLFAVGASQKCVATMCFGHECAFSDARARAVAAAGSVGQVEYRTGQTSVRSRGAIQGE